MMLEFKKDVSPIDEYHALPVHHYQRSIPSYFKTDDAVDDMKNDEYNIKINSALTSNFDACIKWLFYSGYSDSDFAKNKSCKVQCSNSSKDMKMSISHHPGRATMIFVSDVKSVEVQRLCNKANSQNQFNDLLFVPLFSGKDITNANAENLIRYFINGNPEKHIVIFAKQIGSRSFSIPEIDNVCIMIDDPSYASAVQKMCRNQTPDKNFPEKIAKVYWFALNELKTPIKPLFEFMKRMNDYRAKHEFERSFVDSANIFVELDGEYMEWKNLPGSPYQEYLDKTQSTFQRVSSDFELLTADVKAQIYKLCEELFKKGMDFNHVNCIKRCLKIKDSEIDRMHKLKIFEGHVRIEDKNARSKPAQKAVINKIIIKITSVLIQIIMQYNEHKYKTLQNFLLDFFEILGQVFPSKEVVALAKKLFDTLQKSAII